MKNIYLCQPQYKMRMGETTQFWFPYSSGCLWSYAQQFEEITKEFTLKELIYFREDINTIVERMVAPVAIGFSCYVWNEQYCLALAKAVKEKWPNCYVLFGGSQANSDLLDLPYVDSVIINEGEKVFVEILQTISKGNPPKEMYFGERMNDLDIPSPYTSGVFDNIIKNNPGVKWHMIIETNRGCPYKCTFCEWGRLTYSKVKLFPVERIKAEAEWAARNPVTYFYCADANFGMFKARDLEIAQIFRDTLYNTEVESISLQFAKDSNEDVMKIAQTIGPLNKGFTVSVQSMNDDTLEAVNRKNMEINNLQAILDLAHKYDVKTYSEFILGMPEETLESWKAGLTNIVEHGQHQSIEVWLCQILRNSAMATPESRKKYGIKTINVKDYLALHNNPDDSIAEFIEVVVSTNTMSTQDIVEGYMYAWLVMHFHISGYSQILSKLARAKGVTYREFYDCLFAKIKDSTFAEHYNSLRDGIETYLTTGASFFKNGHSAIHAFSAEFIYQHKDAAFSLAYDTYCDLVGANESHYNLQKAFIFDANKTYPIHLQVDNEDHLISSQVEGAFDFYTSRRKGLLKNIIEKR